MVGQRLPSGQVAYQPHVDDENGPVSARIDGTQCFWRHCITRQYAFSIRHICRRSAKDFAENVHYLIRLRIWHPVFATIVGLYLVYLYGNVNDTAPSTQGRRLSRWVMGLFWLQYMLGGLNAFLLAPIGLQLTHLLITHVMWVLAVLWTAAALAAPVHLIESNEVIELTPQPRQTVTDWHLGTIGLATSSGWGRFSLLDCRRVNFWRITRTISIRPNSIPHLRHSQSNDGAQVGTGRTVRIHAVPKTPRDISHAPFCPTHCRK